MPTENETVQRHRDARIEFLKKRLDRLEADYRRIANKIIADRNELASLAAEMR